MNASLIWKNKMVFEAHNREHMSLMDATSDHGGTDQGPTPKELVLNAMMGCTAIDVVSMLTKMRQPIDQFSMDIEAEKNLDHPIHFKKVLLKFKINGNILPEKAEKAVESSLTKYCGVNYMISKVATIHYELILNNQTIKVGEAHFVDPIK
jgi:putative redox protein